jgi:hypothetical protein
MFSVLYTSDLRNIFAPDNRSIVHQKPLKMKHFKFFFVSVMALSVFMASCDKDKLDPTKNNNNNNPTNPTGPTPPTPMPSGGSISGALISVKMKYTSQPTGSPMPIDVNSEMGLAVFYTSAGGSTKADAGTVSVNSNNLTKGSDNSYTKMAYTGGNPSDLGFSTTSNWNVGGSGSVAAFTYDHASSFPNYSGTVPSSVTKANGVTLTLNSTTLSGTDSVYVVIAGGSANVTKAYAYNAGTITISSSDLSALPTVSDNTAVLEICPVRYVTQTIGGKQYVFIKEQAIVKNININ